MEDSGYPARLKLFLESTASGVLEAEKERIALMGGKDK